MLISTVSIIVIIITLKRHRPTIGSLVIQCIARPTKS